MNKILVSACLCGRNVKYDGGNNRLDSRIFHMWENEEMLVPYCPEMEGGLGVPRVPCEIAECHPEVIEFEPGEGRGFDLSSTVKYPEFDSLKVVNAEGRDVTGEFKKGADKTLAFIKEFNEDPDNDDRIVMAVLKEGSPSCGSRRVYDGSFSHTDVTAMGVTAALLAANGIPVFNEKHLQEANDYIDNFSFEDEMLEMMMNMFV